MSEKKEVLRQCVACKTIQPKNSMIRVVKLSNSNDFVIDKTGKLNGRGAYICNNNDCINKTINKKSINRSFKMNVSQNVYDNLRGE